MVVAHGFGQGTDELLKETLHAIHRGYVKALVDFGLVLFGERIHGVLCLPTSAAAHHDLQGLPRYQLLKV